MGERDLQRGDRIKDNDPRMPNRVLEIVGFEQRHLDFVSAICRCPHLKREYRVSVRRIHTDGKARRSGFSRLPHPSPEQKGSEQ